MSNIVMIGSLNMDHVLKVSHIPIIGETVPAETLQFYCGGKGANQAVAASRLKSEWPLGARVHMVGCVGSDNNGRFLTGTLEDEQIDITHVHVCEETPTGSAYICVGEDGGNSIVIHAGANSALSPEHVYTATDPLTPEDWCVFQLESPIHTLAAVLPTLQERGIRVMLNPAPAHKEILPYLQYAAVCIPNEIELAMLTDMPTETDADVQRAAAELRRLGAEVVVVTLGDRGIYAVGDTFEYRLSAEPTDVVDTTGAGDTFIGALAVALSEEQPMKAALDFAMCAAALSVGRVGAQSAIPMRPEVDQAMKRS